MKPSKKYLTQFVYNIPETLNENVLYISTKYNIAVHSCACGCGREVYTPISKEHGWIMLYDGENASLYPSIGNMQFPCRSHYFLKKGNVEWCTNVDSISPKYAKSRKSIFGIFYKKRL